MKNAEADIKKKYNFVQSVGQKTKDIYFSYTLDKEKQQILQSEKLELKIVWRFCLENV